MANLKKGDTFFAPKDILAFKMDDVTVTLSFQKGQKIGIVENIESGYISFLSSFDDGWGSSGDAEFYVYSSDFNVKEDTDGKTGTSKTNSKTTVDDVNDILKKTTDRKETTQKDNAKDTPEPEAKTILGLSTGTFVGVVGGLLLLTLLVVLFWKSDEPKVVYQQTQPQSQPQTLSGVDKADINVMPKINFVES